MKLHKVTLLIIICFFSIKKAESQNAMLNILTQNSGIVIKGKTIFLEITINNTDPTSNIGVYKLRPQISVPSEIVSIDSTGHVLPTGWVILNNNGSSFSLSNGKDIIAAGDARTILIAIRGMKIGGSSTLAGQLNFSNGVYPGTDPGTLQGDNPADNSSTSTVKVILK